METDHVFVWVLGMAGTLVGLGALVWKLSESHHRNSEEHKKIIELLEGMRVVEGQLEDVLSHPDDTQFSVKPVRDELRRIREKLERMESIMTAWLNK